MQFYSTGAGDEPVIQPPPNNNNTIHPLLAPLFNNSIPVQQNMPPPVKIVTQPGTIIPAGTAYTPLPAPPKPPVTPVATIPKSKDDTGTGVTIIRTAIPPQAAAVLPGSYIPGGSSGSSYESTITPEAVKTETAAVLPTLPATTANNTLLYVAIGIAALYFLLQKR